MKPVMNPETVRAALKVVGLVCSIALAVIAKYNAGELTSTAALVAALGTAAAGALGWSAKAPGDERSNT